MENNTANENRMVYAITYTCQDRTAYLAGLHEIYETAPKARAALLDAIKYMREQGYKCLIDHPKKEHVILFNMELEREFHLFIEPKKIY